MLDARFQGVACQRCPYRRRHPCPQAVGDSGQARRRARVGASRMPWELFRRVGRDRTRAPCSPTRTVVVCRRTSNSENDRRGRPPAT